MKNERLQSSILKAIAAITFVLILVLSFVFKPEVLTVLPLFVSIVVLFLKSQVNRYSFLIGTVNSVFYAVAYFCMGLYSMSAYAMFVSTPITLCTFLLWNKNTSEGQTKTRSLSALHRIGLFGVMALVWMLLFAVFSALGSSYLVLDNTLSVLGIAASILCVFRFSEYAILNVVSSVIDIVLYSVMLSDDISRIVWLIYAIYSAVCSFMAFVNMIRREKINARKKN